MMLPARRTDVPGALVAATSGDLLHVARQGSGSPVVSHDSALKAHRQSVERREQNRQMRTGCAALRDIRSDRRRRRRRSEDASVMISLVDKMAGIIHRNTAGRYKSRLASRVAKKSAAA